MTHLEKLRLRHAAIVARQQAIVDAATAENRDLTDTDTAEFDQLTFEFDNVSKQIDRLANLETRSASLETRAAPVARPAATDVPAAIRAVTGSSAPARVEVRDELTGFQVAGLCALATGRHKAAPHRTPTEHLADMGYERIATDCAERRDAFIRETAAAVGGAGVQRTFSLVEANTATNLTFTPLLNDFIAYLRNASAFMRGNPVRIDMPLGSLKIPGGLAGISASYGALGADIAYSQGTTRQVSLSAKHLRTLTAYDNHSARTSPLAVAAIVGQDLADGLVLAMDSAGLRGDGTGNNPSGIRTLTGAGNRTAAAAGLTPDVAAIELLARQLLTRYRTSNVPKVRPQWIMSGRVRIYLEHLRNADALLIYPELRTANPTWIGGYPVIESEQVPSTLGVGTNESELYLADFGHVLMGDTKTLMLETSTEASYINAAAAMVSAFSRDETVIRGIAAHDFALRHTAAVQVATAVQWGAAA